MGTIARFNFAEILRRIDPRTLSGDKFFLSPVTGAVTSGGLIKLTISNHGLYTGQANILVNGVLGTTEANALWALITVVDADHITLDGSTFTNAYTGGGYAFNVGIQDGKFPRERHLDLYNISRQTIVHAVMETYPAQERSRRISGNMLTATLSFAAGVANLPAGYYKTVELRDENKVQISVLPIGAKRDLRSQDSVYNKIVFEDGSTLVSFNANTYIPDTGGAHVYTLDYYGFTKFAMSDITGGTVVETISSQYDPILVELAEAASKEMGTAQLNAMALQLISMMRGK